MPHIGMLFSVLQVLAAYHKSDLSVAKQTVHRLRSLVLVAKLASLLYLGEGTLPFGGPLRLFWSIAGSAIGSTEGAKDGAENRADEEEVARLEVMKVHVLLPPLRKGVRGLEGAAEGGFEDADEDARMAASTSVCMYRQIFSNHQLLDKNALAQELYRAGGLCFTQTM